MPAHATAVRDALAGVQSFFDEHQHLIDCPEWPVARKLLDDAKTDLELHLGKQQEYDAAAKAATARTRELTKQLHATLRPLYTANELLRGSRTQLVPLQTISKKIRRATLLERAREYISEFGNHRELYIAAAVPVDFAERASAGLDAVQQSVVDARGALAAKTGATKGIATVVKRAPKVARHLGVTALPYLRLHDTLAETYAATLRRLPSTSGPKKLKAGGPIALIPSKTGESATSPDAPSALGDQSAAKNDPPLTEQGAPQAAVARAPRMKARKAAASSETAEPATGEPVRKRKRRPGRPRKRESA